MRNLIPVRLTLETQNLWRRVRSFDHGELCAAFNLDPATFHFDLPRTAFREDLDRSKVSGYVLRGEKVVGVVHVCQPGETFRDTDPLNKSDRFDLRQTTKN